MFWEWKFSTILLGLLDFGIVIAPESMHHFMATWAGVQPRISAIWTSEGSLTLCPLARGEYAIGVAPDSIVAEINEGLCNHGLISIWLTAGIILA